MLHFLHILIHVGRSKPLLFITRLHCAPISCCSEFSPHTGRYPFLLVDRVVEWEKEKYAVGYKCITINDNFFPGHFPERAIMPGRAPLTVGSRVPTEVHVSVLGGGGTSLTRQINQGPLLKAAIWPKPCC